MSAERIQPSPRAVLPMWGFRGWAVPLWVATVAAGWWRIGVADAERLAAEIPALARSPLMAGALTAAGKFAGFAIEVLAYRLLWTLRGRALPMGGFFVVVLVASMADLLAWSLLETARAYPQVAPWTVPLVGAQALPGGGLPLELRAAAGSFGLLTIARIWLTASGQARGLGVPLRGTLLLTFLVWLGSRLVIFLLGGLVRGMSPGGTALG